ncbi:hypothetical protein J2S58_000550 [Nakamurella flavida]|nr:hypothetical protein [Nakamurella flavida]
MSNSPALTARWVTRRHIDLQRSHSALCPR